MLDNEASIPATTSGPAVETTELFIRLLSGALFLAVGHPPLSATEVKEGQSYLDVVVMRHSSNVTFSPWPYPFILHLRFNVVCIQKFLRRYWTFSWFTVIFCTRSVVLSRGK
jgi:hypothetical protein